MSLVQMAVLMLCVAGSRTFTTYRHPALEASCCMIVLWRFPLSLPIPCHFPFGCKSRHKLLHNIDGTNIFPFCGHLDSTITLTCSLSDTYTCAKISYQAAV